MKDVLHYIEVKGVKYPLAFNINVEEEIQEKFGSIKNWIEAMEPDEGEVRRSDIKRTYEICINEGIDIENETLDEKRKPPTAKEIGRIITNITPMLQPIIDVFVESRKTGDEEKN